MITDRNRLEHALQFVFAEALRHFPDGSTVWIKGISRDSMVIVSIANHQVSEATETKNDTARENESTSVELTIARCTLKVLGGVISTDGDSDAFRLSFCLPKEYKPGKRNT